MELYIVTTILVLVLVLFKKRSASFLSIYAAASMLYYFVALTGNYYYYGGLSGKGTGPYNAWEISSSTYIVLIINLVILAIFLVCTKEKYSYITKEEMHGELRAMKIVIIGILVLGVILCLKHGLFSQTTYNKHAIMEKSGRIEVYFKYFTSFIFVYVFTNDNLPLPNRYKIMTVIAIALTYLFADRSYIVVSICAVVFNFIAKECRKSDRSLWQYFKRKLHMVILVIVFIVVTLLVKKVTGYVLTGRWSDVGKELSNEDFYVTSLLYSEPNSITRNIDAIVSTNYRLNKSSYMLLWAYIFPFITSKIEEVVGVEAFGKVYQRDLYPEGARNKAATHLGEAFANGGYVMEIIVVAALMFFLFIIYKEYIKCHSNLTKTLFLLIGVDAAFYIHRNSMAYEFSRIRAYIYIYILCWILICLISRKWKIRI